MPKAKTKRRRSGGMKIPLLLVAGLSVGVGNTLSDIQTYGLANGTKLMSRHWLGYDHVSGRFIPSLMKGGTYPLIVGAVLSKIASALGINKMLGRAKIPFIRL